MNEGEVLKRGYAETLEEWWFLVGHHWYDLISIITKFAPKMIQTAIKAKQEKRARVLLGVMNEAWWKAPDNRSIHDIPGWGVMCDLCSDFPDEEETHDR